MKAIKPQRLGMLHRTFENGDECFLAVAVIAFVRLEDGALLPDAAMWKFVADELGTDAALDEAMPKQRGEVLVDGRAYCPGRPAVATTVRVRIADVDKSIRVVGDRVWQRGAMSAPTPFSEMAVSWRNAFGGEGFAQNPLGKGAAPVVTPQGEVHALPNLEDPAAPLRAITDRPAPVSFGGYDFSWPQRMAKVGTYDAEWLKTRFPGFARDLDWSMFNVTAPDQQIDGYFRGSEGFVIENMHPTKPVLQGRLPGLVARCFINRRTPEGESLAELTTRLDTVRIFPHAERAILIYRALAHVTEDDADDVLQVMIACERDGEPRPETHYRDVLARRLDRAVSHLYALRDDELLPVPPEGTPPEKGEMDDLLAREGLLQANLRRRYDAERARMRAHFTERGLDTSEPEAPAFDIDPPPPSLEQIPALLAKINAEIDQKKKEAEEGRAKAEADAKALQARFGLDAPDASVMHGGPPKFSAAEELARLRGMYALASAHGAAEGFQPNPEDPALATQLAETEAKLRDAYRRFAHEMAEAPRYWGSASQPTRDAVAVAMSEGRSLAGADLTGIDLSDMDLRGADLRGAFLECARLEAARLDGADLRAAVLVRADLTGANLAGAQLRDANLGAATLHRATLDDADFTEATLTRADFAGARGARVTLTGAQMMDTKLAGASLPELRAPGLILLRVDLSGMELSGADLTKCTFLEGPVTGANFSGATLTSAVFLDVNGDRARFRGARMNNLRCVQACSFRSADMAEANLDGANLRGACLADVELSKTTLNGADLSTCDLTGARLYRVVARDVKMIRANLTDAVLIGANLMGAILQKARLDRADLTNVNLFRADLAKVRGRPKSTLDALLTQARIVTRGAE